MGKALENEYGIEEEVLTPDQIRKALTGDFEGFKYFFENCMLMQDRDTRQMIHPKMNKGQELIAKTILGYVDQKTRTQSHKECVIIGSRQFGKSTVLTAIANYIEAYVAGMENLNVIQTMHVADAATKFFKQKMQPILSNVHPAIFPTIERDSSTSSILLQYKDVKGIKRGGYYEILSAGSNSVRSGTVSVWLCDEPSEYRNPEAVEDAISGAISSYGWSFTAYIGTFSDRLSDYFLKKIKTAMENPDEMELVFIPWFLVYGRDGDEVGVDIDELSEYERNVMVPEMIKYGLSTEEFAQKIGWYRRRALRTSKMRYEFPTSIEDILDLTSNKKVFDQKDLDRQKQHIESGKCYKMVTDNFTKKVEAIETDKSPFRIFRNPAYGHRYKIMVDPISSTSEASDKFAMIVFDEDKMEQAAVFSGRGMAIEDYADWAVSIAKIYNKAMICPEKNIAQAFVACVRALGYYNFYYDSPQSRAKKEPGIRTTASTKENMINNLSLLLRNDRIIFHDEETINELEYFEKIVKTRYDGGTTVKMAARKGKHDDLCACAWCFAGTIDDRQLTGGRRGKISIL